MGRNLDKFLLLMWKNWVLQYRRPCAMILEIVFVVMCLGTLLFHRYIKMTQRPESHDTVVYTPFCTLPLSLRECDLESQNTTSTLRKALSKMGFHDVQENINPVDYFTNFHLIYSPKTATVDEVMDPFKYIFRNVVGLNSSADIDPYYKLHGSNVTFAALEFEDSLIDRNDLGLDDNVKVSIRFPSELRFKGDTTNLDDTTWQTNLIYPAVLIPGPRSPDSQTGADPNYFKEGFLELQFLLSIFITWKNAGLELPVFDNTVNESNVLPHFLRKHRVPFINMRRFPFASWLSDNFLIPLKLYGSLVILLSFCTSWENMVNDITIEKEIQLKEAMKIMGLPNWLHWTAWFLKSLSYLIILIILIVVALKVPWDTEYALLNNANTFVLLIFLFLYVCATITFGFAVTVFFSKASTVAVAAEWIFVLSYAPYYFIQKYYGSVSLVWKIVTSLGSNIAMPYGFRIIIMYEETGEGIQFNNIWKSNSIEDDLSLGIVMIMLTVDCLLYVLIALYFEAIFPGEFGAPQKWYFPFTKTFWCGPPIKYIGVEDFSESNANEGEYHESEPQNHPIGIKICNLSKSFGRKPAVNNLSLNMYQDQITVLLGHNGAGKTTTMSMLTGMIPPTGGTAIVNGHDIRSDMEGARNSLGLCPQHNILFDDLTVAEHIYFFSKVKGLRGKEIDAEITKYVNMLELEPKINARSKTLSGGMKRKLCIGMALCGNSKVVMLDEPTAGMDPSARRALWDIMLKQKTGRTLMLTTHFMDEADLLGDRIAIMAGGELRCSGSSFFLKKKYGAGYHLIIDKSIKCNPDKVTALLRKHIPNIEVHQNVGSELSFLLIESQSSVFEAMLRDLEQHSKELGINSYGISLTTLEEVFIKVYVDHDQEEMYNGQPMTNEVNGSNPVSPSPVILAAKPMSTSQLLVNQVMAMSMKRILSTLRSWRLLLLHILLPVIVLIVIIVVLTTKGQSHNLPSMPLVVSKFSNPVVLADGVSIGAEYAVKYKAVAGGAYRKVTSINETMLQLSAKTPAIVKRSYIAGASFTKLTDPMLSLLFDVNFTAYFNSDPYHTPAVALGLAVNAMYRKIVDCDNCRIEFSNHPLVYNAKSQITQLKNDCGLVYQIAHKVSFIVAFVSPFYIIFIVRERISKSKHLQFASGVNASIFWLVTWLWDFVTYIIMIIPLLVTLVCFQIDGFSTAHDIGRVCLVFLYFGWSMIPTMYLFGFVFDVASTAYSIMLQFGIMTGYVGFALVQAGFTSNPNTNIDFNTTSRGITVNHWSFLMAPHYSLVAGMHDMYQMYCDNKMCNNIYDVCWQQCKSCTKSECLDMIPINTTSQVDCEDVDENYLKFARPGIGGNVIFSFAVGAILLVIILLVDYRICPDDEEEEKNVARYPTEVPDEDDDVKAEKHKIRNIPEEELVQNYAVVLKDLTKCYKTFVAVNGLCLGIEKYECFGLLGVNGAGKTTTFKMLTGDVFMSYGDAWVNGKSIKHKIREVQKAIGYCPQFDALLDDLTARETLTMFALIRGIPRGDCNNIAIKLAKDLHFQTHLDKKVKHLSGGNKRKLSTSIALIGDPPVMCLDEPTAGMDPNSKRYIWDALCQVRDSGKTIVLTSHSMEEAEALCTKLAIMVNGNFKCLGSTQHLKNKFAEGYTITIKVRKPENSSDDLQSAIDQLEQFMLKNFSGSKLREKHEELLTFYVTDTTVPLSKMFGILEKAKKTNLNIEDYSLGQSSLEQVFLTFTKYQVEEVEVVVVN